MEAVKEYMESGVLELYILGQLDAAESVEVENMAEKYAEVRAEITAIERAMEAYAFENAIEPSANVQEKVLAQISKYAQAIPSSDNKTIPLNVERNTLTMYRYALIACSILLVASLGLLFTTYKDLNSANDQIAALNSQNDQFASTVSKLEFSKDGMENRIAMFETTEWATVKLAGVANSPKAEMLVYWNKTNRKILINHTAMDLPKTDRSHEYQLWALVDGKPVSLGVFGSDSVAAVQEMETITKAQAFAVTIEPMGGSVNPTMEKMVVMGGVSI